MRAICIARLAFGTAAAILATISVSRAGADDELYGAHRCIYVDRIDQTRIVDERSILFFMRDRTVLQNVLPNACHWRKTDPIKYDVVLGKLCADEFITQLIDGATYAPGLLCKIGMFVPIDAEEAKRLLPTRKDKRDGSLGQHTLESKPVELPPAATSEPAAAPASPQAGDRIEPAPDKP